MLSADRPLIVILPAAGGSYSEPAFADLEETVKAHAHNCIFLAPVSLQKAVIDETFCQAEAHHIYKQISKVDAKSVIILAPSYGTTLADEILERHGNAFFEKGQRVHVIKLDPASALYQSCFKADGSMTADDCKICVKDFIEGVTGLAPLFGASPPPRMETLLTPRHFFNVMQSQEGAVATLVKAISAVLDRSRIPGDRSFFASYLNRMMSLVLRGRTTLTKTDTVTEHCFFSQEMLSLTREAGIAAVATTHSELIGFECGSFPRAVGQHLLSVLSARPAPIAADATGAADGSSVVFAARLCGREGSKECGETYTT